MSGVFVNPPAKTTVVFISQPMRGKTDEQIKAERARVVGKIKKACKTDVEIVDSFFEGAPHDANPVWFLGKSIQLLSKADVAYFVNGWQNNRGCRCENMIAREYNIDVIEE